MIWLKSQKKKLKPYDGKQLFYLSVITDVIEAFTCCDRFEAVFVKLEI